MHSAACQCQNSQITSDNPPQILASLHQLDFAPYVSRSYNAQWNALKPFHDKHVAFKLYPQKNEG